MLARNKAEAKRDVWRAYKRMTADERARNDKNVQAVNDLAAIGSIAIAAMPAAPVTPTT